MANREGTFLSDVNMRKHCFEGKTIPMNRLDLMLPPAPELVSPVYYRPTGTNPRMERPINVAAQVNNLATLSKMPKDSLYKAYLDTLKDKPDVKLGLTPRRFSSTPNSYVPDITDEIMTALLEAQVYSKPSYSERRQALIDEANALEGQIGRLTGADQSPERPRPRPSFLSQTRPISSVAPPTRFSQFYPPTGMEEMFGFAVGRGQSETERRVAETEQGSRPAVATLTGTRGRPPQFQLESSGM